MIAAETDVQAFQRLLADFRGAPDRIVREIETSSREWGALKWKEGLTERAGTLGQQRTIVDGADVAASGNRIRFLAAQSTSPLSGGLVPSHEWAGYEFGATPKTMYVRWRGRRRFQLINKQFAPRRRDGKVAWPTARTIGPQFIAQWVDAVVRGLGNRNPDIETTRS